MSKYLNFALGTALAASVVAGPAFAGKFGLGRAALPDEIAAWDKDVRPDGTGLPEGSGSVEMGEEVFVDNCAVCHGDFAEGVDNWPKLAGGMDTLDHEDPLKTVGSYWPYLSTTWDYVNRSMPFGNAQSLTPDEVYGIVAYILYSNDLVEDDFVLSKENFLSVDMPNKDGFIIDDRAETELKQFSGEPCMTGCKTGEVKVTSRAVTLDVGPKDDGAGETPAAVEPAPVAVEPEPAAEAPKEEPAMVAAAFDAELAQKGEKVFKKCKACHQVGDKAKNKTGPVLNGIYNAAAGQVEGFRYSKPLMAKAEEGLTWDDANLSAFLEKPKKFIKKTKMSFAGLKKEKDRAAIIEYLKSVSQ
ncbi:MAG: c-type cytochrome [Halocynthiibacter sp.]